MQDLASRTGSFAAFEPQTGQGLPLSQRRRMSFSFYSSSLSRRTLLRNDCHTPAVACVPTKQPRCGLAAAEQPSALQTMVASKTTDYTRRHQATCRAVAEEVSSTSGREDWAEESRSFAVALAKVADATKALDISVLHVAPLVSWTSYMVICTVQSRPQLLAVLARMEDTAAGDWERSKQNSELGSSQWEVLDFGDVVAHVFTQEQREFYALDDFYAAAEEVPLPFAGSSSSSSDGSSIAGTAAGVDEASGQGLGSGSLWSTHL